MVWMAGAGRWPACLHVPPCRHRCFPAVADTGLCSQLAKGRRPTRGLRGSVCCFAQLPCSQRDSSAPESAPFPPWAPGGGAPHLVLLEVGLRGDLGLGRSLRAPQGPQQDQRHPQCAQDSHAPGAGVWGLAPAVQAERGRPAGRAEAAAETPIYGPGLASTQGPRTAHWRLVMWGWGRGKDALAEPSCGLAPHSLLM